MARKIEGKGVKIVVYLQDRKIDETLMSLPPVSGAFIYAGKPGRRLRVVSTEKIEETYRIDTIEE